MNFTRNSIVSLVTKRKSLSTISNKLKKMQNAFNFAFCILNFEFLSSFVSRLSSLVSRLFLTRLPSDLAGTLSECWSILDGNKVGLTTIAR